MSPLPLAKRYIKVYHWYSIVLYRYYVSLLLHTEKEFFMSQGIMPPSAQAACNSTILIVEDDRNIAQFLQQVIEEETPYHSTVVNNGQAALAQAPHIRPCLMLLDYGLPKVNGLELYDHLQEVEEIRDVPTIMMSATLPEQDLEERGIYQLRKPTDNGGVLRMITHALATSEEKQLPRSV
jgi:two-component system, response regulator, stage 0 sporulation protein F